MSPAFFSRRPGLEPGSPNPRSRRSTWWLQGVALVALLGLAGCSSKDDDRPPILDRGKGADLPPPDERLPEPTADFVEHSCRGRIPGYATQCGRVTVPVAPGSTKTLTIEVLRVFSNADDPAPDPIVYLEGGPGFPGSSAVLGAFEAFEPFVAERDLVVVDQRGTGASGDSLDCTVDIDSLGQGSAEEGPEFDDPLLELLARCSVRLTAEGVDLSAYRTAPSAADVDAVRRALGYDQWNLLGISYGTRLALTVLRDHPAGVRSVVLDSVVPLQVDLIGHLAVNGLLGFDAVFASCAEQEACSAKYPDPMTQLRRVTAQLNETPGEFGEFGMTGDDLLNLLFNLMYHPQGVALIPLLIDEAERGEMGRLANILEILSGDGDGGGSDGDMSFGLHLSAHCAEEIPFTSRETVAAIEADLPEELVGGLSGAYYFDYCDAWRVPPADARENELVSSGVPTLVMAGGFDPITPPIYAELVHGDLENSTLVIVDNLSHGASLDGCGQDLVQQFYDAPGAPLVDRCVASVPAPDFQSIGARRGRHLALRGPDVEFALEAPSSDELADILEIVQRHRPRLRPTR